MRFSRTGMLCLVEKYNENVQGWNIIDLKVWEP